jgi:hypothetical protein
MQQQQQQQRRRPEGGLDIPVHHRLCVSHSSLCINSQHIRHTQHLPGREAEADASSTLQAMWKGLKIPILHDTWSIDVRTSSCVHLVRCRRECEAGVLLCVALFCCAQVQQAE